MSCLLIVAATAPELAGIPDDMPEVEALICGVGPVSAAATTAARLASGEVRPSAVLHVGIAGCRRDSGLELGTLVCGVSSHYCDTSSALVTHEILSDSKTLSLVAGALPSAVVLPIGTSAQVGGTQHSVGIAVEAMEGFGVLSAAALAGVPAVEVRAISNYIEDEDRKLWRFDLALDALAEQLGTLIQALAPRQ